MIIEIASVQELLSLLEGEKRYGNYERFNWRLILLPDFRSLRELFNELSQRYGTYELFFLEEHLKEGKLWLSSSDIFSILKRITSDKNAAIFGLDAILRFFSERELEGFLEAKLFSLENLSVNARLLIPMAGLTERILSIVRENHRIRSGEFSPIYRLKCPPRETITIYINALGETFQTPIPQVNTLNELVQIWKRESDKWLINIRKLALLEGGQSDGAVEVIRIDSYERLIKELLGFKGNLEFEGKSNSYVFSLLAREVSRKRAKCWKDLLDEEISSFQEGLFKLLSLRDYEAFKVSAYLREKFPEYKDVIIPSFDETLRRLYSSNQTEEKRSVLEEIAKNSHIEKRACRALEEEVAKKELNFGILECEICALIKSFSLGKVDLNEIKESSKYLAWYMADWEAEVYGQEWIYDYFLTYRRDKLKNEPSSELKRRLLEVNESQSSFNRWYYSFSPVNKNLLNSSKAYLLDGVGVEWLGFIISIAREYGFYPERLEIGRAELPSITEFNLIEKVKKFNQFDSILHKNYSYPNSIVLQMRVLETILKEIFLSGEEEFYLLSDHGATTFSRLEDSVRICKQPEHDGRYCSDAVDTPFGFIVERGKSRFTVARFHNSLGRRPSREAHGGATPEEVLIPIIKLVKGKKVLAEALKRDADFNVNLRQTVVRRGGSLELLFSPKVPEGRIELLINGKPLKLVEKSENLLKAKLPPKIRAGSYTLEILVGGRKKEVEVKIRGGMEEEELL